MQVITAASEAGAAGPAPSVSAMAQPTTEEPVLLQFWGLLATAIQVSSLASIMFPLHC